MKKPKKLSITKRIRNAFRAIRGFQSLADLDRLMENGGYSFSTNSGVDINQEIALSYSAFWSGVQQIAQTIASLPCFLYLREERGKRPYIENPLFNVLKYQANRNTTAFIYFETMMFHLLIYGNSYSFIVRDKGNRIIELIQLNPQRMKVKVDENTGVIVYEFQLPTGNKILLTKREIFHVHGLGFDGFQGYSVLQLAREAIGLGKAQEEFQSHFIGQGTNIGGVITHPNILSEPAKDNIKKSIDSKYGGLKNSHKLIILEEGMSYERTVMPLEDAQFLESRVFQVNEIARWLNMPPHKLKELSHATFDNISAEQISYLQDTIRPWLERIESEISSQLIRRERRIKVYAEFFTNAMLRADPKTRNESLSIQRMNGVISANDWRNMENMNPLKGDVGTILYQPVNMAARKEGEEIETKPIQEEENADTATSTE